MKAYNMLKESFKTGVVILLPLIITVIIVKFLAGYVFLFVDPIVRSTNLTQYTSNIRIIAQGIAVFTVVIAITLLGYISSYKASERLSKKIEWIIKEIPVFGSVYDTVDRISNSFSGDDSKFEKVVLIEFPKEGVYSLGLVTSEAPQPIEGALEEDMQAVYIPLSPNPTMANLVMVNEDQYKEIDMTVQEGLKVILTTGVAYQEDEASERFEGLK